jgi:hypothetical protein
MSLQGRILIYLVGLGLIALIVNLVRTRKLHVSYAVVWVLALLTVIVLVSIPPLLDTITIAFGAIFPASALSLMGFVFIFLALVFISMQLSMLSARVVEIAHFIAMNKSAVSVERAHDRDADSAV